MRRIHWVTACYDISLAIQQAECPTGWQGYGVEVFLELTGFENTENEENHFVMTDAGHGNCRQGDSGDGAEKGVANGRLAGLDGQGNGGMTEPGTTDLGSFK